MSNPARKKQRVPMLGDMVVFYEQGKVSYRTGKPGVIEHLDLSTDLRAAVYTLTDMQGRRDGVFHVSALEIPGAITPDQQRMGLWAFPEEHRALHDEEIARIELHRAEQAEQYERQQKQMAMRREAVIMLRAGQTPEDVSKATGISKDSLAELLDTVVA